MLQDIKNTIKQFAIYGLSRISVKFISFVITPIISIYFTVSEYGVLDRFERLWQILFAISLFGMETTILRWYILTEKKEDKEKLIFTILSFMFVINAMLIVIALIIPESLSSLIFDTSEYSSIVILTFFISAFEALLVIPLSLLRAENKAAKYLIITSISAVINLVLQLYFLLYTQNKLEGIFISKLAAPLISFIILIPYLGKRITFKFDNASFFQMVNFAYPLMLVGVVSSLLNSANRFILGFLNRPEEVGLFSLASNISGIITFLLISPFQLAFNSIFWQKLKDNNALQYFTKSVTYSVYIYIWGALALSLLIPFVIKIYIPSNMAYWQSVQLVPVLSLSLVFYGMLTIAYMSYHHAKRNDLLLYFQAGALILNIILNYLLIPIFGMHGAAISTFISYFVLIVTLYYFSKRFYFIKYELNRLSILFLIAALIITFFYTITINIKLIDIISRLIVILLFPMLLYLLRFYESVELNTAKNFIRKLRKKNV